VLFLIRFTLKVLPRSIARQLESKLYQSHFKTGRRTWTDWQRMSSDSQAAERL